MTNTEIGGSANGSEGVGSTPRRQGRMARYLLGRFGEYAIVLMVALAMNFALPRALPGGPLKTLGSENVGQLSPEDQARLLQQYKLDRPIQEQFMDYLRGVFTFDFGKSFVDGQPVLTAIGEALPWTLLLVGTSLLIGSLIGIALGVLGGLRRQRGRGSVLLTGVLMFDAMPAFWLGMMLIFLFGVYLRWLPTFGVADVTGETSAGTVANHLVLPVTTLVLTGLGQFFLVTRYSLLSVLSSDPVEHARARGIPRGRLVRRHALRPALLPVHTILMMELGFLVGGALVVETVFAYPGLGRLTFTAIQGRDYPMMQAAFLVLTLSVVVMNALADATYVLLDPRVRREAQL